MKKYDIHEVIKLAKELANEPECVRDLKIAYTISDIYYLGVTDGIDRLAEKLHIGEKK